MNPCGVLRVDVVMGVKWFVHWLLREVRTRSTLSYFEKKTMSNAGSVITTAKVIEG